MLSTLTVVTAMTLQASVLPTRAHCCPLVELRQYTLNPNKVDGFIRLFELEVTETQEAVGMTVIGHFRDQDNPDRFVWLRGFPVMPARAEALPAFYGGLIWKAHRDEANANFIDTDNVLFLQPVAATSGFALAKLRRPAPGTRAPANALVVTRTYTLDAPVGAALRGFFEGDVEPELQKAGNSVGAALETESSPNIFSRLPVRAGENVFLWLATSPSPDGCAKNLARLNQSRHWRDRFAPKLRRRLKSAPQFLRLTPASRSLLRG